MSSSSRILAAFRSARAVALLLAMGLASSCAKEESAGESCTAESVARTSGLGDSGLARVFNPDPITSSGVVSLGPKSTSVDDYAASATLNHLLGSGVLEGKYVYVRSGLVCGSGWGAFSEKQDFSYPHSDPHFQESNAYFAGDGFRATLDQAGYLLPSNSVRVVAHCVQDDNAYYTRIPNAGGPPTGEVCIGDSVSTPGASYADDSTVVVHELQHATTGDTYSLINDFNQFWYDEAGSLNEAISDFMALGYFAPVTPETLDPRTFSRWALGTFSNYSYVRGAHQCPEYDPTFPNCTGYALGAAGFDSATGRVSFSYPDGLGWPYAQNYGGTGILKLTYQAFPAQEEIHNSSTIATGALGDVIEALKTENGGDAQKAYRSASQLVMETIKQLPKPSASSFWSPVTFRGFAETMLTAADLLSFTSGQKTVIVAALKKRGLLEGSLLQSGWGSVGPGQAYSGVVAAPGLSIQDDPVKLKAWLSDMGMDTSVVRQGDATVNHQLEAGETVAVWFDIQNDVALTAGGLNIKLTSQSTDITFLRYPYNVGGASSSQAQIQYQKVNGSGIVAALSTGDAAKKVTTTNTYFGTNPYFNSTYTTAVWIKAAAGASGVKTIQAQITPANGETITLNFDVEIH